jgi:hypothetical protein
VNRNPETKKPALTSSEAIGSISVCENCSVSSEISKPNTCSYEGDVGGQKTLRSYWRNYFEKTDALIWVVDATDRLRIEDCGQELASLLVEEVSDCARRLLMSAN